MKWLGLFGVAAFLTLAIGVIDRSVSEDEATSPEIGEVSRGELVVRTAHEGRLESRKVIPVASGLQGPAAILKLTDEGVRVEEGDLLVAFDTTDHERESLRFQTEVTVASAELEKLVEGRHPMEMAELRNEIAETRRSLDSEEQYLRDSRELARDNLVSPAEIAQQEGKVEGLREKLSGLRSKLELTRDHLHPMEVRRAEARLEEAREELARARRQLDHGRVVAPGPGVVVYQPLHIAGEFRTVRVGDTVYANQPFMKILDFSDLVVQIAVPEAELGTVREGNPVMIQPSAYPEERIPGRVERVSEVAQTLPDKPSWQRYFRATIGVLENHPRLRPGMSVVAQVVGYRATDVVKIPRRAVRFDGDAPTVRVVEGDEAVTRELTLGQAGERHFEVLDGVEAGERVLLQ